MKTEVLEKVQPTTNSLKGYKQTEVGLIPEDWEIMTLKEVSTYRRGSFPQPYGLDKWYDDINGFPFVQVFDVDDNKLLKSETKRKISIAAQKMSVFAKKGSIVLTIQGSIGRLAITQYDSYIDRTLLIFESFLVKFDPYYFATIISILFQKEKENAPGGIIKTITKEALSSFLISFPKLSEQTAIATALSDADALIRSLEQLIEKKKKIKQGAMQELLRPKEGWVRRKLGDECELITKGTTPTSIGRNFQLRGINFIKIESLAESGDIIDDKVAFIDEETHSLLKRSQIREGDLLFSIAGALGRVALVNLNLLPANTNQALAIIRLKPNSNIDVNYLYHYLKHEPIQNHILMINVQGAQANLSLRNIDEFQIEMPDLKSQIQISSILNLLEIQIFNLKMKLEKAQLIKQGMMQNLLTGKIRLI